MLHAPCAVQPERTGDQGDHGDRDDQTVNVGIDHLPVDGRRAEDEGKLADLGY